MCSPRRNPSNSIIMQIHQINASHVNRPKKRVGRGGKRGTYSGHGGKGQTARAGRNFRPIVREILKRYPKLRGYQNRAVGKADSVVAVGLIDVRFEVGAKVPPRALVEKKIIARVSGKYPVV